MKARYSAVAALALSSALGVCLSRQSTPHPDTREVEILRQIVERREAAWKHELARREAGISSPEPTVVVFAALTDARSSLARALGDTTAQRQALVEQLDARREYLDQVRRRAHEVSREDVLDAEIAVLECELRIERITRED